MSDIRTNIEDITVTRVAKTSCCEQPANGSACCTPVSGKDICCEQPANGSACCTPTSNVPLQETANALQPISPAANGQAKKIALPVAIIGGGPIGLVAAAHLHRRGEPFILFEVGETVAANIWSWRHVRFFSPWRYSLDDTAVSLLKANGWQSPPLDGLPRWAIFWLISLGKMIVVQLVMRLVQDTFRHRSLRSAVNLRALAPSI